jgi:hypothetical protein
VSRLPRAALVLALAACSGSIMGPGPASGAGGSGATGGSGAATGTGGGAVACAENQNDTFRLGLAGACAGCHSSGNRPLFASLEAFENGLVWDKRFVLPGDPDNSQLVKLLEGRGTGTYPQMPTGESFAQALASGKATVTLAQVKEWIRTLPAAPPTSAGPSPEGFTLRRLTAEEMVTSLMDQLGLTIEDFVSTSRPTWRDEEYTFEGRTLGVWPVDAAPGISRQYVSDARSGERFLALGGPNIILARGRDKTLAPASMQTLVQVSQAWCAQAIDKPQNRAVLSAVTLADKSATKAADIQKNIAALHLRMLGAAPTDAEVAQVYALYLQLEPKGTRAAWTAVCAAYVRHPQWLTF